MLGTPGCVR